MLSKAKIKFIRSLEHKKGRNESGCFLAEGNKLVNDTLAFFPCDILVATESWLQNYSAPIAAHEVIVVTPAELKAASLLTTPQEVLAVYRIPHHTIDLQRLSVQLSLALDGIQDPGNLGTIVRIADWYGIEDIVCSNDCVDIYTPKCVQATMGALARVRLHYVDLPETLSRLNTPIYGTLLDGENIYTRPLSQHGIIVMGNEGKGISKAVQEQVNERLFLPPYPADRECVESLNVGVATAIVCAEFRRLRP